MRRPSFLDPTLPARRWLDAAWLLGFGVVFLFVVRELRATGALGGGLALELPGGTQRFVLRRGGRPVARLVEETRRVGKEWLLAHRVADDQGAIGEVRLRLRSDLSVASLGLDLDGPRFLRAFGPVARLPPLLARGRFTLKGTCELETGHCQLEGRVGRRRVSELVEVGRGPVLAVAVRPLLVRGVLGRQVELALFDPLSLVRRNVRLELGGRERRRFAAEEVDVWPVREEAEGRSVRLWLDARGRLLRAEGPGDELVEAEEVR